MQPEVARKISKSIRLYGRDGGKRKFTVTAPLLPRWLGLDAGNKLTVVYEVVKELMPGFGVDASDLNHVFQFFDPVIGQCGDGFVSTDIHADDISIYQIVVIADDRFKKFGLIS